MLDWSQQQLCDAAKISRATLKDLENDTGDPRRSSYSAVERALKENGVQFFQDGDTIGLSVSKRQTSD